LIAFPRMLMKISFPGFASAVGTYPIPIALLKPLMMSFMKQLLIYRSQVQRN